MAKGVAQLQKEGDKARKNGVDAANKKQLAKDAAAVAKMAKTPLTADEQEFVARIALKMNNGRAMEAPSAAEVLKYSKLVGRKDITQEEGE